MAVLNPSLTQQALNAANAAGELAGQANAQTYASGAPAGFTPGGSTSAASQNTSNTSNNSNSKNNQCSVTNLTPCFQQLLNTFEQTGLQELGILWHQVVPLLEIAAGLVMLLGAVATMVLAVSHATTTPAERGTAGKALQLAKKVAR